MWDQDLFKRALDFAARAHGEQRVPGSNFSYVVHLTKVATEVLAACAAEPGRDVNLAMTCALLHDAMEDADVTADALRNAFGPSVADGVRALTKDKSIAKAERMKESLARIAAQPHEIWMVKLGDRITNLEPPPDGWSETKRRAYLAEAREIRAALGAASAHLAKRLDAKIAAYDAYVVPATPKGA